MPERSSLVYDAAAAVPPAVSCVLQLLAGRHGWSTQWLTHLTPNIGKVHHMARAIQRRGWVSLAVQGPESLLGQQVGIGVHLQVAQKRGHERGSIPCRPPWP